MKGGRTGGRQRGVSMYQVVIILTTFGNMQQEVQTTCLVKIWNQISLIFVLHIQVYLFLPSLATLGNIKGSLIKVIPTTEIELPHISFKVDSWLSMDTSIQAHTNAEAYIVRPFPLSNRNVIKIVAYRMQTAICHYSA